MSELRVEKATKTGNGTGSRYICKKVCLAVGYICGLTNGKSISLVAGVYLACSYVLRLLVLIRRPAPTAGAVGS